MSRKAFIEASGATCKNWTWSWSFVNSRKKTIIFGSWDIHNDGLQALIFTEEWQTNRRGHKTKGYAQSREHIRLIEEDGYKLMTFPIKYSDARKGEDGLGPNAIGAFIPTLTPKLLTRIGNSWYAADGTVMNSLAEEITRPERFAEGAKTTVTINAFERNPQARKACIAHHGTTCSACQFHFENVYGSLGEGFIHVHHIKPIGSIGKAYKVNPVKDLVPVCPNCHAMIHKTEPPLTIKQLRSHLANTRKHDSGTKA